MLACSVALLSGAAAALAQTGPAQSAPAKSGPVTLEVPVPVAVKAQALLPQVFDGWVSTAKPKVVTDAAEADSTNAAALKEYGFTAAAVASYKRDGDTLNLRALRFNDASGAYGAYSFYRQNGWPKEEIGTGATSDHAHNRVLFWKGGTVVDATFSQIGPMSAAELRELAGQLPVPQGNRAILPPILANLPQDSLDEQTTHYALGPAGYAGSGGVLPPELVGFDRGAETVTANYSLRSGPATLTIIDYPTPQMAAAQETKIRDYIKAGSQAQPPWPKPLQDSDLASLEVRRSGPLVALVSGDAIPDESHKLLGQSTTTPISSRSRSRWSPRSPRPAGCWWASRPSASLAPALPSCSGSSSAAAGRSIGSRAASRPPRSMKSSSSVSIWKSERLIFQSLSRSRIRSVNGGLKPVEKRTKTRRNTLKRPGS